MEKETAYDCGWRARGTDQELIAVAQEHGRQAHDMVPGTRTGSGRRQARHDAGVSC